MFNKANPLVSIIVPSYNHEKYIVECIESIFNQTYKNFELIVIDDGSKDNSKKVLENLKSKYEFTLVFQNNKGISATLNRGIKEFSRGKYITFCASDDFWADCKLKMQVQFMEDNQFYPMCYGKTHYINESSEVIHNLDSSQSILKGGWIFKDILLFKIHPPVNYLFHRGIFDDVGFYDEKIFAEDYYMNLKISSKYPIGFIDEFIGYYRLTDVSAKVIRSEIVSDSHLMSIELYKSSRYYNKAKRIVCARRFATFSGFMLYKKKSLSYLKGSLGIWYHKIFIVGMIRLLFSWK